MKKNEGLIAPTKTRPAYQCQFYSSDGKRKRLSTGCTDYHTAWNEYQTLRKQHGLPPDTDTSYTLGRVLAEYETFIFKDKPPITRHTATINRYYEFWTPETPWHEITTPNHAHGIQKYVDQRLQNGIKQSTIRRELATISAAAERASRAGADIKNPRKLVTLKIKKPGYYWLTQGQARQLLNAAEQSSSAERNSYALHDYIKIALFTGMRPNEILTLKIDQVLFAHGIIHLPNTKNDRPHDVPIAAEIIDSLKRRIDYAKQHNSVLLFVNPATKAGDKPASAIKTFINPFKTACTRAGIPLSCKKTNQRGMKPYDLRHTFATWLRQQGVSIEQISDMLNHSDIKMTMIYAHHDPNSRAATVDKLPKI